MASKDFADRTTRKLYLFDVDMTLSLPRQQATSEMMELLKRIRKHAAIGFVGGSNLPKIAEQLSTEGGNVVDKFDYAFAENGLTAFKMGKPLQSQSFIKFFGEDHYKKLVNFCLHYIADLDIPLKRGTFVEFRNGMINVSPIGRNATIQERNDYEAYDKEHKIRETFVQKLKETFPEYDLTYSIGGQISFDIFPRGWDKTYCLKYVEEEGFEEIHFFGDKTYQGGNDFEIFTDIRTIGHTVLNPDDTMRILRELIPQA